MKELITEVTSASISSPVPTTTDEVVRQYEAKLNQSIALKVLAAQTGPSPVFSKEEMAYLNKKAYEESQLSEVKVITPDPTITLKKGKTEINIRNAATLVKKMEEIYPSPNRTPMPLTDGSDVTEEEIDEIIEELENENEEPVRTMTPRGESTMRNRFQAMVNHPVSQVSPEVARCVAPDEKVFQSQQISNTPIKTVNKNAYEIRTEVLAMALDWVKFRKEFDKNILGNDEDVLNTAQKFYRFVEDKRR